MILLLLASLSLAEAQPPATGGCRAFVLHILKKHGIASLDSLRPSGSVSDSGELDRPYIRARRPSPSLSINAFPGREDGSYQLELSVPPMRGFVYRLHVRDHSCALESVQVNEYPQRYNRDRCANPSHPNAGQLGYVREACALGADFFPASSRPGVPTGGGSEGRSRAIPGA
jgi:hypothetical protein